MEFFDTHFTDDNPHLGEARGQFKNMMLNWQKMERLAKEYDKVWLVEDDTIPPEDALFKLLETGAPVVSGLYAARYHPYAPNVRKELRVRFTWEELSGGGTIVVNGAGTGCTLIDRTVLDKYEIDMGGYHENLGYDEMQIDFLFSKFCIENGIEQLARLDVQCGHRSANGKILWPKDFLKVN